MPDPSTDMADALMVASPQTWRDMCFSLPAVRSLAECCSEVTILCPARQQAFWQTAGFDQIIAYEERANARSLAKELDGHRRALFWEPGIAADACSRAGVAERIGLPAAKLAKQLTTPLERKVVPGPAEHQVQRMLETVERLGAEPLQGRFFQPISSGIDRNSSQLLVSPESDLGSNHEWPMDSWLAVITWLLEQGRSIQLGQLHQAGLAARLAKELELDPISIDPSDPTSYAGYHQVLSADSSLPHLAGAFGAVCAVLFGPGDPVLTRPLSQRHLIIRRKVECSPCFLEKCPIDLRCQHDLTADRVISQLGSFNPA